MQGKERGLDLKDQHKENVADDILRTPNTRAIMVMMKIVLFDCVTHSNLICKRYLNQ